MTSSRNGNGMWLNNVPIPRMLEIMVQELKKEYNDVPCDFMEQIIPLLCFSLPPNSQACSQLLHFLPPSSSAWEILEKGLANQKYLAPDILVTLYQQQPSILENNVFHIFSLYAQNPCIGEDRNLSTFTVEHFQNRGLPSYKNAKMNNLWHTSKVIAAAEVSKPVFTTCIKIFFKLAIDTQFSMPFMYGASDFFSCLFHKLGTDLFKYFPSNIQYVIYLLTLPLYIPSEDLKTSGTLMEAEAVDDTLLKVLKDNGVQFFQSLLCFFPYWLPVLSESKFYEKYLQFYT